VAAEDLDRTGESAGGTQPGAAVLKTRPGVLLAVGAALLIAGCGSSTIELPVRTEYDHSTPFPEWKTFRLSSEGHDTGSMRYPRYEEMVRQAVVEELSVRGYTRIEDGTPDFRVAFELSFRGGASAQMAPKMGSTAPEERAPAGSNPAGSLALRMLDPISAATLWEGTISEFTINVIEPEKGLRKAVWRVLVEFPPLSG
jgi:hypothetical protein